MSTASNATAPTAVTQRRAVAAGVAARPGGAAAGPAGGAAASGLLLGALGVALFSFTLPATRLAVADLDPWFVASGRAAVAGVLAVAVLAVTRAPRPTARQWRSLAIVSAGVIVGFPLFTSLAMQTVPSGHGAVVVGVLPATTAVAAVVLAGEREPLRFWLAALAGLAAVTAFAISRGAGTLAAGDLFMLLGVVACGIGYAEGGALSRELGGARTICWALLLTLPLTMTVAIAAGPGQAASADAWLGFAYVSLISMFLGFFAWYAGLARGGIARIGQIQLAQPVITLLWAALILSEHVGVFDIATAIVVLACVVATQRARE
ncbi:MAG TPA: DMT family transporter [Solirubrobacteraceae bacterium]